MLKPELIDGLVALVDSLRGVVFTKANADSLNEALTIAKSAIPSGQVAEDVALLEEAIRAGASDFRTQRIERLSRLAAQAQSAETYRGMWETATRELGALSSTLETVRREREEAKQQARLGWERHAEKDRAYGEVIAQRDACERDLMQHFEAKNRAMAEVVRLRNVLGNIATACEGKDLRALNPEAAALALRNVLDDVWRWATAEAGGEVVPKGERVPEHADKATDAFLSQLKAEPSQPIRLIERDTLTLRDEFAMAALHGLRANLGPDSMPETVAKVAYADADAMLKERAKP